MIEDELYCVYNASRIVENARGAGLSADCIAQVRTIIDPNTGDAA